jgi:threonylcarbamoyladenosine tRNA methylthiotransferase MtaB
LNKIINLGCKVNQYEGYCLLKKFKDEKNVVIVNTCCVTHEAELKSLKKYRAAMRRYPNSRIIVTGCTCTLFPSKFKDADTIIDLETRNAFIQGVYPESGRSRYFLKIQDGCTSSCTYCIVAKVRNRIESKAVSDILEEINQAVKNGFHEVVLVGANIGLYGAERGERLIDLLHTLARVSNLPRIRLSSIEPQFVTDELLHGMNDIPICRHFHIPIQSADDSVLKAMGRAYSQQYLYDMVDRIRSTFDSVMLGADVIVGFPNEGEQEFLHTYQLIDALEFAHVHVFPYSPRPLTSAFSYGDRVSADIKRARRNRLVQCVTEHNLEFRKQMIGRMFDVIIEKEGRRSTGLTDNYVRVSVDKKCALHSLVRVVIADADTEQTIGHLSVDA